MLRSFPWYTQQPHVRSYIRLLELRRASDDKIIAFDFGKGPDDPVTLHGRECEQRCENLAAAVMIADNPTLLTLTM